MKKYLIPSKTFLLGEYSTLFQGPALVATLKPYFEFQIADSQETQVQNFFHEKSPAGIFYSKFKNSLSNKIFSFQDPYSGAGGFGASTAQFLALYQACHPKMDPFQMLQDYRLISQESSPDSKMLPSGADLMAQYQGGITYFNAEMKHLQKMDWKFRHLNIHFLATGNKLATHEHLKTLQNMPIEKLKESTLKAVAAIQMISENDFLQAVREFSSELLNLELVASHTRNLLQEAQKNDFILACKGCGAMGSDTLMLVTEKSIYANEKVLEFARLHQLKKISDMDQVAQGLHEAEEIN